MVDVHEDGTFSNDGRHARGPDEERSKRDIDEARGDGAQNEEDPPHDGCELRMDWRQRQKTQDRADSARENAQFVNAMVIRQLRDFADGPPPPFFLFGYGWHHRSNL